MEEMIKDTELGQPEPKEEAFSQEQVDTTPQEPNIEPTLEIKFNKETKKLSLEEARAFAQKGMKLDLISEELQILHQLSKEQGIGFKEFVKRLHSQSEGQRINALRERYSEDSELQRVLSRLDNSDAKDEFSEMREIFPEMCDEEIPQEVKTAAKNSGKGLLFEYLLYQHRQTIAAKNEADRQEMTRNASLGSLSSGGSDNTADAEFLRGVWG